MQACASGLAMRLSPWSGLGRQFWAVLILATVQVGSLAVQMAMYALGVPGLSYPQMATVASASVWFAAAGPLVVADAARLTRQNAQVVMDA